jgi:hypothetical protein
MAAAVVEVAPKALMASRELLGQEAQVAVALVEF